jgi:hypothetical protein
VVNNRDYIMNKTLRDEIALAVLPAIIIAVATASLEDKVKLAFIFADEFIKQSETKNG